MYDRHGVNIPAQGQLDVVNDAAEAPLDGSTEHLEHDVHLLGGELEQQSPQSAAVEHLTSEPLLHGSKIEHLQEN